MRDKLLLVEIRQAVEIVVADDGQDIQVVVVGRFRQFLGHVDTADIVGDQIRDISAHDLVLDHRYDAGREQDDGNRTQAQDHLGLQRQLDGLLEYVSQFDRHIIGV